MTRASAKSWRVATAAAFVVGVATQAAVDGTKWTESRSVSAERAEWAERAESLPPATAVMRMRDISQLRTLTASQRSQIDQTLGRHRELLRGAATSADRSRAIESLLAEVENVLTPVQRRHLHARHVATGSSIQKLLP